MADGDSHASNSDINVYGLIPNHDANLAALICFAFLWFTNTVLGVWYRQWWFGTAFFIGCGLETAGYIGRFLSSSDPIDLNYFLVQIICLTLAPAFFMAGVYFLLAKFAMIYGNGASRLKPMWYSYIFISCDLCSIVLQAIGGGMAAMALQDNKDTDPGTHIMVAGLAVQVAAMTLFIFFCGDFAWRIRSIRKKALANGEGGNDGDVFDPKYAHIRNSKLFVPFLFAMGICTILIYIRCIYRMAELAEGWSGYLILHETYFLVLEALIVFLGVFALSALHPGFLLGKMHIPIEGLHKAARRQDADESNQATDEETAGFEKVEQPSGNF